MVKQEVLVLKANRTYEKLKVKLKKDGLHFPKRIQEHPAEMEPLAVLEEDKPKWKFWRNPKRLVIHYQGNIRTMKIFPVENKVDMGFLTIDDIVKAVKTAIVKALSTFKSIRMDQFLILVCLAIFNLCLVGYMMVKIGIF